MHLHAYKRLCEVVIILCSIALIWNPRLPLLPSGAPERESGGGGGVGDRGAGNHLQMSSGGRFPTPYCTVDPWGKTTPTKQTSGE